MQILKKVLSLILGASIACFGMGGINFSYAASNEKNSVTVSNQKQPHIVYVTSDNEKEGSDRDQYHVVVGDADNEECNYTASSIEKKRKSNGIKKVGNHPFKIIFRAGGWGILGAISSLILPIPKVIVTSLAALCGGVSKAIELYESGYSKDV